MQTQLSLPAPPSLALGTDVAHDHTANTLTDSPAEPGTGGTAATLSCTDAQTELLLRRQADQ